LGYTVLAAQGPTDALRRAREWKGDIHLVITDVVMPEMNGRELSERLAAERPGLKQLFMSGYTADVIAHRGVLDEGVRFLKKPFSIDALAMKVREALDAD
jgi:CheY-like chemotaxis protein